MPAKNSVKTYIENGIYHVYNRGVNKADIFLDDKDFRFFLYFLKYYLEKPNEMDIKQRHKSLYKEVKLLAYCLMPNHFHLLLKQLTKEGMTKLLRAVCTNYVCYVNKRYGRSGTLLQGKYRAVLVLEEPYLLHLSRYIHKNPGELTRVGPYKGSDPLQNYPYSSYPNYLNLKQTNWLDTKEILGYFRTAQKTGENNFLSYQSFVEDNKEDLKETLGNLTLD